MNDLLEKIKNWSIENLVDNKTIVIIITGSAIQKPIEECNDIDIFIIKDEAKKNFYRSEEYYENYLLDLNYLTIDELNQKLKIKATDFWEMNWTSVYLELIRTGMIWYQRDSDFEHFLELGRNWQWDESCFEFIDFKDHQEPEKVWLKKAYYEHLELLAVIKKRLEKGEPISYRRKDLPEMRKKADKQKAKKIYESFIAVYNKLSLQEDWEEVVYARKAMQKQDWDSVVLNVKDGTRWLILPYIREEKIDILDPKLWKILENKKITDEITAVIKEQYS
ncbi:MAG: hypothetical protein FK733_17505 [Asgard group archaeon]|nr:hypothetical protein [Asgard group archaeon]